MSKPDSPDEPVTLASFCLARVGGVSAQPLTGLALTQTVQHLQTAFAAETAMQALAPRLADALYKLVPQTEGECDLRRCVLRVKRNVYNLRLWPEAVADIQLVSAVVAEETRAQLRDWQQHANAREAALAQAAASYSPEVAAAGATLAQVMQNTDLQAGIAIASPSTLTELVRTLAQNHADEWKPTSKIARSSLAYYTRAALKPSPLSTFTQLAIAQWEETGQRSKPSSDSGCKPKSQIPNPKPESRNHLQLLRALPYAWMQLMVREREFAPFFSFAPNVGLYKREAGKIRMMQVEHTLQDTFALRTERIATRNFQPQQLPELAAFLQARKPATYAEILAQLNATGRFADPHQVLVQLLDLQFLRPLTPYSQSDRGHQALTKLAAIAAQAESEHGRQLAALLRTVQQLVNDCAVLNGVTRVQLLTRLRQTAAEVFEAFGAAVPTWLPRVGLIYEDVRYTGAPLRLTDQIKQGLVTLATLMRPRLIRSHLPDFLYGHFVRCFGTAGQTNDILGFLQDFLEREDLLELMSRARSEDRLAVQTPADTSRAQLPAGISSVAPSASVYFQVAAANEVALARGEYQIVVNEIHSGQGGLVGRFTDLLRGEHDELAAQLRQWIKAIHADVPVLEVPVMSEWNNLHSRLGVTDHALQWPGEAPSTEPGSTYQLHELTLRADAEKQALYFTDAQGQPVALTYLGLVPGMRFQGPLGLLLLLLEPWFSDYQIGKTSFAALTTPVPPTDVEFTPREEQGRLVLQRARWRFPVAQVPVRTKGETEFAFFVRVQQWRAAHNLPEELFALTERPSVGFDARYRKPVWVHLSSPHTLELLRQILADDAIAITFTEALPSRTQHWVAADEAAPTRVSEFVSLFGWPQVTAAPAPTVTTRATPAMPAREEWLYYKIYPARFDQMDDAVRRLIAPARALARLDGRLQRWFFLRFVDEHGPHLRLRLQGPADFRATLGEQLAALFARTLPQLTAVPRPLLLPHDGAVVTAQPASPRVVQATYEPEYEKYGGPVGVALAETLFEASSELALRAATLPTSVWTQLSLQIMKATMRAAHPQPETQRRWLENYLWYWSGQDRPRAQEWRTQLNALADQCTIAMDAQAEPLPAQLEMLREYHEALTVTLRALSLAQVPLPATRLCFDYLHVHNNRWGLTPPEEGLLAAVLLSQWD